MAEPRDDLDAKVRKADPDRWLSSRFIGDAALRADVVTIYALDAELAAVARRTSQPTLGEIRLVWWREALEELERGAPPRSHPVLLALAEVKARRDLSLGPLFQLIEARSRDLDPAPFESEADALAYADRTSGAVAVAVARLLDPGADPHRLQGAARAWGVAGLVTAGRFDTALGATAVRSARLAAQTGLRGLSSAAFPSVAHAALANPSGRRPGPFEARLRVIGAVARGRI
jgi:phytoene synthase